MKRREFILKSCYTGLALTGASFLFTECKSAAIKETENEINIPQSLMKKKNNLLVGSSHLNEKVLLVRQKDGAFHALLMKCTHKGSSLQQKDKELVCPSHGSSFDMDGNVAKSPAKQALKKFPVTIEGTNIIIHLV